MHAFHSSADILAKALYIDLQEACCVVTGEHEDMKAWKQIIQISMSSIRQFLVSLTSRLNFVVLQVGWIHVQMQIWRPCYSLGFCKGET